MKPLSIALAARVAEDSDDLLSALTMWLRKNVAERLNGVYENHIEVSEI
jgi:hypothetical protein